MKHRNVRLTDEALADIDSATQFYEKLVAGLGQYFFDSIITDLEALEFFGGIHQQKLGYYCCPSKRFPFLIYYDFSEEEVSVVAILDTRANPDKARRRLHS
jgi:hypothetical protein